MQAWPATRGIQGDLPIFSWLHKSDILYISHTCTVRIKMFVCFCCKPHGHTLVHRGVGSSMKVGGQI